MLENMLNKNRNLGSVWNCFPQKDRILEGLSRRLARLYPGFFSSNLSAPVFFVGFNNSGKSIMMSGLPECPGLIKYPDEGNSELWFKGFFPWIIEQPNTPPIWCDPDNFVEAVLASRDDDFIMAKAHLGAYQWLQSGRMIINDSGMLGGLLPSILHLFSDAKIVHFIRNGKVAAYLSARREWTNMIRNPEPYLKFGCDLEFDFVYEKMIYYWSWMVERLRRIGEHSDRYIEFRYEKTCANSEMEIKRLVEFVGCDPSGLNFQQARKYSNMDELILQDILKSQLDEAQGFAQLNLSRLGY